MDQQDAEEDGGGQQQQHRAVMSWLASGCRQHDDVTIQGAAEAAAPPQPPEATTRAAPAAGDSSRMFAPSSASDDEEDCDQSAAAASLHSPVLGVPSASKLALVTPSTSKPPRPVAVGPASKHHRRHHRQATVSKSFILSLLAYELLIAFAGPFYLSTGPGQRRAFGQPQARHGGGLSRCWRPDDVALHSHHCQVNDQHEHEPVDSHRVGPFHSIVSSLFLAPFALGSAYELAPAVGNGLATYGTPITPLAAVGEAKAMANANATTTTPTQMANFSSSSPADRLRAEDKQQLEGGENNNESPSSIAQQMASNSNGNNSTVASRTTTTTTTTTTSKSSGSQRKEADLNSSQSGDKDGGSTENAPATIRLASLGQDKAATTTTTTTTTSSAATNLMMTKPVLFKMRQQQKHLTMTASKAEQETPTAPMNAVVCNSRCDCVELEFAAELNEQRDEHEENGNQNEHEKTRADKETPQQQEQQQQIELIIKGQSETNSEAVAAATAASKKEIESGADHSRSGPRRDEQAIYKSNRIALIEFSRDYSFDELASDVGGGPAAGDQDDEAAPAAAASDKQDEQTTATATTTTKSATGNGSHQEQQQASGATLATTTTTTTSEVRAADRRPTGTIKHANDQSKIVNVSSTYASAPASASASASASATASSAAAASANGSASSSPSSWLLSIKDNKTGTGGSSSAPFLNAASEPTSSASATPAASTKRKESQVMKDIKGDVGAQQLIDKDGWPVRPSLASGPSSGVTTTRKHYFSGTAATAPTKQAANFYPYLTAAHHRHYHMAKHQAAAAASHQAAAAASSPFITQPRQQTELEERPIRNISPLRVLDWSSKLSSPDGHLVDSVTAMLKDIDTQAVQSLVLRQNNLKFELWAEIYSLLAVQLRRSDLAHLDLSHNSLVKLGVTFTGYIEHHLAYQLIVQNNKSWPFSSSSTQFMGTQSNSSSSSSSSASTTATATTTAQQNSYLSSNYFKLIQLHQTAPQTQTPPPPPTTTSSNATQTISAQDGPLSNSSARRQSQLLPQHQPRHPNLGEGNLYNSVRGRLPLDVHSLTFNYSVHHERIGVDGHITSTSGLVKHPATILHQAAKIKALDLSYNKLKWLINDQFRVLKHVQSIRLDHNQLRFIHQKAFNGLEELKYLNLNHNRMQTIYMEQFETNYNLQALFLKANYLTYLRAGSFASLGQLKHLDLSRNKFTLLSSNAFVGLDSLETLNLSSNQFVHAPSSSFHSLVTSLTRLDLSRNQLAQLTPGTFFHLKLEQLWLEHNNQLVAIDRGAFWDLPYLTYLSVKSSQMLLSINSQAFVGVPNLQTINYNDCPLLSLDTKQMLDNITMTATTLRLLKQHENEQAAADEVATADQTTPAQSILTPPKPTRQPPPAPPPQMANHQQQMSIVNFHPELGLNDAASKWPMKYVYSLGCIVFVVVLLKLMFKYTSSRHYLDARRRRRRVYQDSSSGSSPSSSSSSSSSNGASSDDASSQGVDDLATTGEHFALHEQQPHKVIRPPPPSGGRVHHEASPQLDGHLELADAMSPPRLDQARPVGGGGGDVIEADVSGQAPPGEYAVADQQLGYEQRHDSSYCPVCCFSQQQQVDVAMAPTEDMQDPTDNEPVQAEDGHQQEAREAAMLNEQSAVCCDNITTPTSSGTNVTEAVQQAQPDIGPQHQHQHQQEPHDQTANDSTQADSRQQLAALDLIHNQLVAAGFDYGHANCAHFYQCLGPALQLADLTANLVNQMDYYS